MIDLESNSSLQTSEDTAKKKKKKNEKQSCVVQHTNRTDRLHFDKDDDDDDEPNTDKDNVELIAATNALLRRYERLASMADGQLEQDILLRKRQEAQTQREQRDDEEEETMSTLSSHLSFSHSSSSLADEMNNSHHDNNNNDVVTRLAQERDDAIRDAVKCREQVEALLSAIQLMARLAAVKLPCSSSLFPQTTPANKEETTETTIPPPPPPPFAALSKPKRRRCGSSIRQRLSTIDRPIVVRRSNSTGTMLPGGTATVPPPPLLLPPRLDETIPETHNEASLPSSARALKQQEQQEEDEKQHAEELALVQRELDTLFSQWNMASETSVPSLLSSIYRLRSQVALATDDAEHAHQEAQEARREVHVAQTLCRQVQVRCETLQTQNRHYGQQLRTARHAKRHLAQDVSRWAQRTQVLSQEQMQAQVEHQVLANHLLIHEGYLKMATLSSLANKQKGSLHEDDSCSKATAVTSASTDAAALSSSSCSSDVEQQEQATRLPGKVTPVQQHTFPRSDSPPFHQNKLSASSPHSSPCQNNNNLSPLGSPSALGRETFQNFDQFTPPLGEIQCGGESMDEDDDEDDVDADDERGSDNHRSPPPSSVERVLLPSISSLSSCRQAFLRSSAFSSSSLSSSSLITDESSPTLRLSADSGRRAGAGSSLLSPLTLFTPRLPSLRLGDDENASATTVPTYRLVFPVGQTIGIQIKKVPLEPNTTINTTSTLSRVLSGVKGKVDDLAQLMENEALSSSSTTEPEYGFLVCGFQGFNDARNSRPSVGSRLVRINHQSLEQGLWTFEDVKNAMKATKESTFTMTFRADPLTPKQQEIVQAGIVA